MLVGFGARSVRVVAVLTGLLVVAAVATATPAVGAGKWIRTACMNPDGSAAPSEGWSGVGTVPAPLDSRSSSDCSPTAAMFAGLNMRLWVHGGAFESLHYHAPDGSQIVGGQLSLGLSAKGFGDGVQATAGIYAPADDASDAANIIRECKPNVTCGLDEPATYLGVTEWTEHEGSDVYVVARCPGLPHLVCKHGGNNNGWWAAVT